MWEDLKKQVPFFAGAEVFVKQLFSGDFSGAFKTLAAESRPGWKVFSERTLSGHSRKK